MPLCKLPQAFPSCLTFLFAFVSSSSAIGLDPVHYGLNGNRGKPPKLPTFSAQSGLVLNGRLGCERRTEEGSTAPSHIDITRELRDAASNGIALSLGLSLR